jgi:hypothetical protein
MATLEASMAARNSRLYLFRGICSEDFIASLLLEVQQPTMVSEGAGLQPQTSYGVFAAERNEQPAKFSGGNRSDEG